MAVLIFSPQYVNIYITESILYRISSKLACRSHLRNEQGDRKSNAVAKSCIKCPFQRVNCQPESTQARGVGNERSVFMSTVHVSLGQESKPILARFLSICDVMTTPGRGIQ